MNSMTILEGSRAFLRLPKGIFKEVNVYTRSGLAYVPHGGGYVQVRGERFGQGGYATSHPDVIVQEWHIEAPANISHCRVLGANEPRIK